MKIVGVTQRSSQEARYKETRDALDQRWYPFFVKANILPIILPNCELLLDHYLNQFNFDGLLLTGGDLFEQREKLELQLLDHAIEHTIPLVGVCHGMQMIQKYYGIHLEKVVGHIEEKQKILIDQQESWVNSYHEYGTIQTTKELLIWAKAADGVVKAIKHASLPIYGIMWHPERMEPFRKEDLELFQQILGEKNESCDFSCR